MRTFCLALLLPAIAIAEPMIDRPVNLRAGSTEVGILGNSSSWDFEGQTLRGQAGAIELAHAFTDDIQLGVAVAGPVNPQFGFGSLVVSGVFGVNRNVAVRLDGTYERLANESESNDPYTVKDFYGVGFGVPVRAPLGRYVALVTGEADVFRYAQFTNVGANGQGVYVGATNVSFGSSDLVTFAHNGQGGFDTNYLNITVPLGLLFQVARPLAITVETAIHAQILVQGTTESKSTYIPIGAEIVLTPTRGLDIGASFSVAGETDSANVSYTAVRNFAAWLRLRTF